MKLLLLGASGSIGSQSLDVIAKDRNRFSLVGFSLGNRTRKIAKIVRMFPEVKYICIKDKNKVNYYQNKYPQIHFYSQDEGLIQIIIDSDPDMVINALVGLSGLKPSVKTLELNKELALANKESLVVGGEIINDLLASGKGKLYPIDSEHAALSKCINASNKEIDKLIITASGGAFRKLNREQLKYVKASDALKHPTWKMGNKITIDCASMMNKTFEVIEAHYLFNYPSNRIDVLLHDESNVHSLVKYKDGTYRADISKPDMRNPIRYALYQTNIIYNTYTSTDYHLFNKDFHFHDFDIKRYPILKWAKFVIENKGTYGSVLNGANEVLVNAYLKDEIPFLDIERIIDKVMKEHQPIIHPTLQELIDCDKNIRELTEKLIGGRK